MNNSLYVAKVKAHVLEAKVSFLPKNWGEQAGLFWYSNDHNYAKLVVEGMKDGTVALVFAVEIRGEPKVLHKEKLELRGSENELVLRLELSPKLVLSACVVHPQGKYHATFCLHGIFLYFVSFTLANLSDFDFIAFFS